MFVTGARMTPLKSATLDLFRFGRFQQPELRILLHVRSRLFLCKLAGKYFPAGLPNGLDLEAEYRLR